MKIVNLLLCILCVQIGYSQRSDFAEISFTKADSIAMHYKGASLNKLPILVHNLTVNLKTDVEKFRAIYTWVSTNIENDYDSYAKTKRKRSKILKNKNAFLDWNKSYTPKVFKKLIQNKKTACTGYAYLLREMTNLASIPCEIVNGYGKTATVPLNLKSLPNHSWNRVLLNNKWYLCDATWSAGQTNLDENNIPKFNFEYHDGYFLATPELFILNHYPLDSLNSGLKKEVTFKEFIAFPIVYNNAFKYDIIPTSPTTLEQQLTKNETLNITLLSLKKYEVTKLNYKIGNGSSYKDGNLIELVKSNKVTLGHTFTKTGVFDIQIYYGDQILYTYVAKIKR
ncbi:hypothetical protein KO500_11745 [Cellulophaga baltica]|uniref:transglutaminase domain-containing protein n=1 Tax=Cellulophaga TaxID=104264 RepID=UPI001C07E06C|nr:MULTISPECIES: transglutaminase domain-containing protein [Cellulophaga]MBU2997112.1 hypothetical protein [Cellulophaga baltica]MDO6768510.1 transglutaminase domain-containing protein [Cellulophaga sp. 1_MG-2023]